MRENAKDRAWEVIGELKNASVNDVLVCRDLKEQGRQKYLLWRVKDHNLSRKLFKELWRHSEETGGVECFSRGTDVYFVFDYRNPRPLQKFFQAEKRNQEAFQRICRQLILACASCALPNSILYLALRQGQVHLDGQGEIVFSWNLDLSEWRSRTQQDCVWACTVYLLDVLTRNGESCWSDACRLLERKRDRNSCRTFRELYDDIALLQSCSFKKREKVRWAGETGKNRLFRALLYVCGALSVLAVSMLILQLAAGDPLVFRIFMHNFERIGTESLI